MSSIQRSLRISASALTAERLRMDVISNNVANSQTTRTAEGGPYRRKQVVFLPREQGMSPLQRFRDKLDTADMQGLAGVKVQQVVEDDAPTVRSYDPSHPDADAEGFVEYPNVDVTMEMVDMMAASRAYQANVTVIRTVKNMAQRALEIGR
jgi:flagellar basal-body rod protein FlgC